MIDHLGVPAADYEAAKRFYEQALQPLGYGLFREMGQPGDRACGMGVPGSIPDFWIYEGGATGGVHLAFRADDRAAVDAFHRAALAAGARDNGPPGVRAQYHPNYYGAFVHDLDGNNIEAVCHTPGDAKNQTF